MAFDQTTRNRLQRFVNDARRVLEEEFTRQLQNDYGMDPNAGTVAELASLRHINDAQRETARILRDTLAHYTASGDMNAAQGLDRIVREQAFTVLNRLAALRMAEARGLLVESVGNGFQAKGFQLYARLAGTGLGETGDAYRVYLFSVFDELAQDLPGLFDRYSPQGRLFPREAALLQVLNLINDADIALLWGQDETIGWIYQYFNSKEERKAMREASQAPRNSRELAVRNQFFTPRYVVEFLVDNTLGRLWYETTQGTTTLRDRCQYLLCTPQDVFLRRFDTDDLRPGSVAALVQAGRWSDLPTFDTTETGVQAMIEFAHCVNTYDRYSNDTWGDYFQRLEPALREQRFADLSTQELWDGIFLLCRADRHGGDGSVYQERWFVAACQEIVGRLKSDEPQRKAKVIAHHPVRDPRTLKLLDPACGSMHFGLYAFDLFAEIYREAWAWEQQHGPGSLQVPADVTLTAEYESKTALAQAGKAQAAIYTEANKAAPGAYAPLCQAYADEAALLRDVPRLIIEHNIYGVDIDPRAAQIASLALWLRAQRAWHDAGVKAKDRPLIGRGHVVAAIAPPAELELRQQFVATLDHLDAELFEKTLQLLKGLPELGVLLQVERELPHLIRQVFGEHGSLFKEADIEQWQKAEARLRVALTEFAQAAQSTYQGRLFAQDALQGLRLIDLCREVFDVVVMNPPFGALPAQSKADLVKSYPRASSDLLSIFVDRGLELLRPNGRLGAITSRACFFAVSFADWRRETLLETASLDAFLDLGQGVMDDAMVEAAAYSLTKASQLVDVTVIRSITDGEKSETALRCARVYRSGAKDIKLFRADRKIFALLPNSPFAYWADKDILDKIARWPSFEPSLGEVRKGLRTGDNFRFTRTLWEIGSATFTPEIESSAPETERKVANWTPLVLSGASQPWYSPIIVALNWKDNGRELRQYVTKYGSPSRLIQAEDYYFRPGMSWTLRAKRFIPYIVPSGCIPTGSRPMAFPVKGMELQGVALSASRIASAFLRFYGEKFEFPKFLEGKLKLLPCPKVDLNLARNLSDHVMDQWALRRLAYQGHEPFFDFIKPFGLVESDSVGKINSDLSTFLGDSLEAQISQAYGLSPSEASALCADLDDVLSVNRVSSDDEEEDQDEDDDPDLLLDTSDRSRYEGYFSYAVGCVFGRWDIRFATGICTPEVVSNPFQRMPKYPPGQLHPDLRRNLISGGDVSSGIGGRTDYPISIAQRGILVDDPSHRNDMIGSVREVFSAIFSRNSDKSSFERIEQEICNAIGTRSLEDYVRRPSGFFSDHLKRYTKSRRRAPLYWPIATASNSYVLWMYYPSLSSQTLYTAINDFVEPKLKQVDADVAALRNKASARTRDDEKQFEALQAFELELIELRDTLLKLAPAYKPNHDDGVQISAAPLWPLFRHKPWQKVLKDTWAKLEKGDYDWAHLAMNYWPERVREKCKTDRSLAIAHGLEDLYVEPEAAPKKTRGRKKAGVGE